MLPSINTNIQDLKFDVNEIPSINYRMLLDRDIINGKIDKLDAMRQVIYKVLHTERYEYIIYSWNYGIELVDLIGQDKDYVVAVLPKRITDALLQDDRITNVDGFEFDTSQKRIVQCTFKVHTIYGDIEADREVNY